MFIQHQFYIEIQNLFSHSMWRKNFNRYYFLTDKQSIQKFEVTTRNILGTIPQYWERSYLLHMLVDILNCWGWHTQKCILKSIVLSGWIFWSCSPTSIVIVLSIMAYLKLGFEGLTRMQICFAMVRTIRCARSNARLLGLFSEPGSNPFTWHSILLGLIFNISHIKHQYNYPS